MSSNHNYRRRTDPEDFFLEDGSAWMRLSRDAATLVCTTAASRGRVVVRIEGGVWRDPAFEARQDSIWDGADPPLMIDVAMSNNLLAAKHVEQEQPIYDVFIITAAPTTG